MPIRDPLAIVGKNVKTAASSKGCFGYDLKSFLDPPMPNRVTELITPKYHPRQMPDTAVIMARTAAICTPVLKAKSAPLCA